MSSTSTTRGSSANRIGTLTSSSLTGLGMTGGISYSNLAAVNITLGAGTDSLTVASTIPGHTALFAGGGPDTINVQAISGPTTLWGGTGNLTTNVGSTQPVTGGIVDNISAPLVVMEPAARIRPERRRLGQRQQQDGHPDLQHAHRPEHGRGITYSGMAAVNVALGQGSDLFTIASTHTGTTSVQCGNGADLVDIDIDARRDDRQRRRGRRTRSTSFPPALTTYSTPAPATRSSTSSPSATSRRQQHCTRSPPSTSSRSTAPTTVYGDGRDVINVGSRHRRPAASFPPSVAAG